MLKLEQIEKIQEQMLRNRKTLTSPESIQAGYDFAQQEKAEITDEVALEEITKLVATSCYPEWDDNGGLIPYESLSDCSLSPAKDVAIEILSNIQSIYRAKVEKQQNPYRGSNSPSGVCYDGGYERCRQDTLKLLGGK